MKLELNQARPNRRLALINRLLELPRQAQWTLLTVVLVLHDAAMVFVAFKLSYLIRFHTSLGVFQEEVVPSEAFYNITSTILVAVWLIAFILFGLYQRQNLLMGTHEAALLFNAASVCSLLVVGAGFFITNLYVARGWITIAWLMTFVLPGIGRYLIRLGVRRLRAYGFLTSPALLIGANVEGQLLVEQLGVSEYSGLQLVGFVDDQAAVGTTIGKHARVLGGLEDIDHLVQEYGIEEIILASSALTQDQIMGLFTRYGVSGDVNIHLSTGLYQVITTGLQVDEFAGVPLVKVNKVRLTGFSQFEKALIDYLIAVPAAIVLLPLFLVLFIAIKLDSKGSVIYRRRVMGVNGKQFDAFKFRTMYVNGDEILNAHPALKAELELNGKLKDDPRITRVGKLLRKTSLDELPQIINVLRNQMSIVGPRMISPPEMAFYKEFGINLLTVKPGITGLWQVSGRSDVAYEDRVRLDMYYIRNWSFWLDIELIWRTIPAVLKHRGAY